MKVSSLTASEGYNSLYLGNPDLDDNFDLEDEVYPVKSIQVDI